MNSNIAVGEIVEVLSVSKTAVTENYVRGGDVTYVISAVNSGSTPLTGVSITDDLGDIPSAAEHFTLWHMSTDRSGFM